MSSICPICRGVPETLCIVCLREAKEKAEVELAQAQGAIVLWRKTVENKKAELAEAQDRIRYKVIELSGASDGEIGGAGCDTADPVDLMLAEIEQGFNYVIDQLAEAKRVLEWYGETVRLAYRRKDMLPEVNWKIQQAQKRLKADGGKRAQDALAGEGVQETCVPPKSHRFCKDCQYWAIRGCRTNYGECTNENSMIYRHSGGSMVHHSSYCNQWELKRSEQETPRKEGDEVLKRMYRGDYFKDVDTGDL